MAHSPGRGPARAGGTTGAHRRSPRMSLLWMRRLWARGGAGRQAVRAQHGREARGLRRRPACLPRAALRRTAHGDGEARVRVREVGGAVQGVDRPAAQPHRRDEYFKFFCAECDKLWCCPGGLPPCHSARSSSPPPRAARAQPALPARLRQLPGLCQPCNGRAQGAACMCAGICSMTKREHPGPRGCQHRSARSWRAERKHAAARRVWGPAPEARAPEVLAGGVAGHAALFAQDSVFRERLCDDLRPRAGRRDTAAHTLLPWSLGRRASTIEPAASQGHYRLGGVGCIA